MVNYPKPPTKSNLKIIAGRKPAEPEISLAADDEKPEPIRLSGLSAVEEMEPGHYTTQCVESIFKKSRNQVVSDFVIIDGEHTGTALRQWINGGSKNLNPNARYAKECAAALGRQLSRADDLSPAAIFKGKTFLVYVGWRLSKKPGGGGPSSDENALHRKDPEDFLRVLHIVEEESL
jgi:hypothetical protein